MDAEVKKMLLADAPWYPVADMLREKEYHREADVAQLCHEYQVWPTRALYEGVPFLFHGPWAISGALGWREKVGAGEAAGVPVLGSHAFRALLRRFAKYPMTASRISTLRHRLLVADINPETFAYELKVIYDRDPPRVPPGDPVLRPTNRVDG